MRVCLSSVTLVQTPWYRHLGTNYMSANLDEISKVYEIEQLPSDSFYYFLAENTSQLKVFKLNKNGVFIG